MLAHSVWNYKFDHEGNLIQKVKHSGGLTRDFGCDHLNRLTHAEETTSYLGTTYTLASVSYDYDGLGRRVHDRVQTWSLQSFPTVVYQQTSDTTRRNVYDGSTRLADLNGSNTLQTRYVTDPTTASPAARINPSGTPQVCWYVTDKDGAILDLVDDQGRMRKRIKEGGFKTDSVLVVAGAVGGAYDDGNGGTIYGGWAPNSDGSWTFVSWTVTDPVDDRVTFGGQEYESATGLLYAGGRWYDQDQKRYIGEEPGGLEGTNAYRYPRNSPSNVKVVPRQAHDFFEAAADFGAGAADTITGGLTRYLRQGLGIDAVNYDSAMYQIGSHVGQAINVGLMFANPGEIGGVLGGALERINYASATGSALSGIEALTEGRVWDAALCFAGMGLSMLRGRSPCGWRSAIAGWGQRGLHALAVVQNVGAAWQALQEGDVFGALVDLADAGANAYRFQQACFAEGVQLRTPLGLKKVEDIQEGDELLSRSEFDPDGPVLPRRVLEKYERTAEIVELGVQGQVIRTTAEHPYHEEKKGWLPCGMLEPGDRIRGEAAGEWLTVERVTFTGEVVKVYNFHVADFHTYFVSGDGWGFSVWAHNSYGIRKARRDVEEMVQAGVRGAKSLQTELNRDRPRSQQRGYVFQVKRSYRYFKRGELQAVEFKTQPGNRYSPRVDMLLKNGQRVDAKSWKGWRSQADLAQISDPKVRKRIQKQQANQLLRLSGQVHEYLRTPGSRLHLEMDGSMPPEVRSVLKQLKGQYRDRLTWRTIKDR